MANVRGPIIERRRVPGSDRFFSAVAISVDPPAVAPPSADARAAALLRRAREHGVTTFDVADARFPQRAERLIAEAFPSPDPDIAMIVGRSLDELTRDRTPRGEPMPSKDLGTALEESLEQSRRRLAPCPISVLEWKPGTYGSSGSDSGSTPPPFAKAGVGDLLWSVRLPRSPTELPRGGRSPVLLSGELSLLDPTLIRLFETGNERPQASLIARNPFSDGRLDGSRIAARTVPGRPGEAPVDLRRLHDEFDPILRLGFLTTGHRRTLAQAALQFALAWSRVITAVIPLPDPERFDEVLGFGSRPPLTDDELAQLGLVK